MRNIIPSPLMVDLYCGLGGWSEGGLAEGYYVVGFDIERHVYGDAKYPAQLVLQDVLTLHGSQFKDAALIVASPPCQAYSYRAMPWKRAKALPPPDNSLFEACFRIQREACEAAGRHIPLIVENVRGAQKWVGRSRWNFGSFHLWGDVPALMPIALRATKNNGGSWFNIGSSGQKVVAQNPDGRLLHKRDGHGHTRHLTNQAEHGVKGGGFDLGEKGFNVAAAERFGHLVAGANYRRTAEDKRQHIGVSRRFAAAMIAKIPFVLSSYIAQHFHPSNQQRKTA